MVASARQLLAVVALGLVAGCSDTDPVKAPSAETDPTPRVPRAQINICWPEI